MQKTANAPVGYAKPVDNYELTLAMSYPAVKPRVATMYRSGDRPIWE